MLAMNNQKIKFKKYTIYSSIQIYEILGVNLSKYVINHHLESDKILLREINKNLKEWRYILCS